MTTGQKYGDIEMKHASLRSQLNFEDVDEHLGVVDINGTLGFFLQTLTVLRLNSKKIRVAT